MARFSTEIRIDASKEKVWDVLADLGSIYKWNPGVSHSYSTSEEAGGEGATRHCDLRMNGRDMGYLEERAFDWREGEGYKIDIYDTNLPVKRNIVTFQVKADGESTVVIVSPDYQIKFGPVGWLIDKLFVQRQLKKGMRDLLAGLKYHVETGEVVTDSIPSTKAG